MTAADQRTVQFLVERTCPVEGFDRPRPDSCPELPFALWVIWPAADPIPYSHEKCDGLHYKVTHESALELGIDFATPWVCEHMGRIIE